MLEAWQVTGALNRELTLPRGRGRSEDALFIHLGETLVHGWDLAVATAQRPAFDVDVVEASLTSYASWLPAAGRPGDAPFADASPVAEDADPIDRLAAYLGGYVVPRTGPRGHAPPGYAARNGSAFWGSFVVERATRAVDRLHL